MRMEVHQRTVVGEIIIGGIHAKVGIGNGGMRHDNTVNNPLQKKGRKAIVGMDVVNGKGWDEGKKSKTHCLFNQKNQTSHMMNDKLI